MTIHEGYLSGCIGDIVALHARTYAQIAGFGASCGRVAEAHIASRFRSDANWNRYFTQH